MSWRGEIGLEVTMFGMNDTRSSGKFVYSVIGIAVGAE